MEKEIKQFSQFFIFDLSLKSFEKYPLINILFSSNFIFRSVKYRKKMVDEKAMPDFESNIEIENRGECANEDADNKDEIDENSSEFIGSADMDLDIKTDDVPEQIVSSNNHEFSLGENNNETINAQNDIASNDDSIIINKTIATDTEQESQTTIPTNFGDTEFIRKQWHRRLRTPVWARCSIQIHIIHLSTTTTHFLTLSISFSLFLCVFQ